MQQKRLKDKLKDKSSFVVIVELTGGPNFNFAPIEKFLKGYKAAGDSFSAAGFDFVGITATDNPSGTPNIEPANFLSYINTHHLKGDLDFIPHISCKDENADALVSGLAGLKAMDVESVLVVTGDKPAKGKGVFELDSIGLLHVIQELNSEAYLKARPEELDGVHQFFCGAVVSPFKYTQASQMQQYYKMEKKIACGARFLITQLGWDWRKSVELFRYLEENNLNPPVIGNVFCLSTSTPAPRLMHDLKLPGCFVSDELYATLCSETIDEHIERTAQQVAMYKSIGAAGVDIGSVHDFEIFAGIINRAAEIGDNWQQYKDNLYWPKENGFYLYDETGKKPAFSKPKKSFRQRFFNFAHRYFLTKDCLVFRLLRKVMTVLGAQKDRGFAYKCFSLSEFAFKRAIFDCQMCGDCYLPENFGWCTIGDCEKGMDNAPCGDARVDGYCGNNPDLVCVGERIYNSAAAETHGIDQWRATINKPRIHALEQTPSILNHLFERDHTAKAPLIIIADLICSYVPKVGKIIKQLHSLGADAYAKPSGPLNYIRALIESQAAENADYIALNLDNIARDNQQLAIDMMVEYVRLVRQWGKTVPVCIDSNDIKVVIAGLKQWYNADEPVRPPLLGAIRIDSIDEILPLKKDFAYAFITTLDEADGQNKADSVERLHSLAKSIFTKAVSKSGFKPGELFFELSLRPLAADMPAQDDVPGCTYIAFETIKKIKSDPHLKNAHCLIRSGNAVENLPSRKIGVCRAYLAKAMEYGLDAAFADAKNRYGMVEPDGELLKLVETFANINGTAGSKEKANILMDKFAGKTKK